MELKEAALGDIAKYVILQTASFKPSDRVSLMSSIAAELMTELATMISATIENAPEDHVGHLREVAQLEKALEEPSVALHTALLSVKQAQKAVSDDKLKIHIRIQDVLRESFPLQKSIAMPLPPPGPRSYANAVGVTSSELVECEDRRDFIEFNPMLNTRILTLGGIAFAGGPGRIISEHKVPKTKRCENQQRCPREPGHCTFYHDPTCHKPGDARIDRTRNFNLVYAVKLVNKAATQSRCDETDGRDLVQLGDLLITKGRLVIEKIRHA